MSEKLEFKVNRFYRYNGESKIKAFVDLVINDSLLIKGVRIVDGKKGLFVSMPQEKGKDNHWYDVVQPIKKEIRAEISNIVINAYKIERASNN